MKLRPAISITNLVAGLENIVPRRSLMLILPLVFLLPVTGQAQAESPLLAAAPPMGWNSWDGYGTTIKESEVKANAQWFADHLKAFGWQYVIVDMEWFVTNP